MSDLEIVEYKAPSGDLYKIRRLTFRERLNVMKKATSTQVVFNSKGQAVSVQNIDYYSIQEDLCLKCIAGAPWLESGKSVKIEDLDKIKIDDANELIKFMDNLNYPKKEVEENSDGQSEPNNQ